MLKSKKIIILVLAISLVIGIFNFGIAAEKEFVGIATGGTSGTYYPVGGALAQTISNNLDGIVVTAQSGNGSRANLNLIGRGQVETGFSQSDVAYWSYTAKEVYKNEPPITNIRGIAALFPETVYVYVNKDSEIKTIEDLRGKKIGVGPPNGGMACSARIILGLHGITFDDFIPQYLDSSEMADRFIDGQVDACFISAGYPSSYVLSTESKRDIRFIPLKSEKIKEIVEKYPYYKEITIPTGVYKSLSEPLFTVAVSALWVCESKLSTTSVYKMTKALWEHRDVLEQAHFQGKNVTLETALDGMSIPLHPGAELYYKEVGLIK
jgi:TRAP transporter TAXI family solute receptor